MTSYQKPKAWNLKPQMTAAPELWRDMIAFWPFWAGSGLAPQEIVSGKLTSITGTQGTVSWVTTGFGRAFRFADTESSDDDTKTIRFSPGHDFNGGSSFTAISCFARTGSTDADDYLIGTDISNGWYMRWGNSNNLLYKIDDGSNDAFAAGSITGLNDGAIHVAVMVNDAVSGRLRAYVDGEEDINISNGSVGNMEDLIVVGGIGAGNSYNRGSGTDHIYNAVSSRAFSPADARWLSADPFAMLRPARNLT